jgi:hypothetical protein
MTIDSLFGMGLKQRGRRWVNVSFLGAGGATMTTATVSVEDKRQDEQKTRLLLSRGGSSE